jgi:aryl-alcohol dehydrogenase-like predicted oxidoreductase
MKDQSSVRAQSDVAINHLLESDRPFEKDIVDMVEVIAKERDVSMAVIATAWCIHKGVNPIVGFNSIERIDEAVLGAKTVLSEEEIARLDSLYRTRSVSGY